MNGEAGPALLPTLLACSALLLAICTTLLALADDEQAAYHLLMRRFPVLVSVRSAARMSWIHTRSSDWWQRCVPELSTADYVRTFRVDRFVFGRLADSIRAALATTARGCNIARASSIELLLAMCLYKASRPITYWDLAQKFGVTEGHAYSAVHDIADLVIQLLYKNQVTARFPKTVPECAAAAAVMQARYVDDSAAQRAMRHCIGALDGTLIPIWCPSGFNDAFYCRKGFYAVNMQACCDGYGFITWIGGGRSGSAWDGNTLAGEALVRTLLPNLPEPFYIACDSGYRGTDKMLCPYKRNRCTPPLSDAQRRFNYIHSLLRGIIEKTFGILKARFRWMLKGVQFQEPAVYVKMFHFCAIVHNLMTERRLSLSYNEAAGLPGEFEVEMEELAADKNEVLRNYMRKYPDLAPKLEAYYRDEIAWVERMRQREIRATEQGAARRRGRRGRADSAADDAIAVPEGVVDTADEAHVVEDSAGGVALRNKIFIEMKLDTYVATQADKEAEAGREQKRTARAVGGRGRASSVSAEQSYI